MSNEMDIKAVSPNHVYTAFKAAGWPVPSNLMNTMHQAGTEGWLDTEEVSDESRPRLESGSEEDMDLEAALRLDEQLEDVEESLEGLQEK